MAALNDNDVILNVYELTPEEENNGTQQEEQQRRGSAANFFARMLTPIGFGAYHTSIDVGGFCYTFAAGGGIGKTSSVRAEHDRYVPRNGIFRESIVLGQTSLTKGQVNQVINRLSSLFFTRTSYHLIHRNCNHFTETFATALLLADKLCEDSGDIKLEKYPKWVNRLAKSGVALGITEMTSCACTNGGASVRPAISGCNVLQEAKYAVGAHEKVGWEFSSSSSKTTTSQSNGTSSTSKKKKKELTPAQRAALAKLRGSTNKTFGKK